MRYDCELCGTVLVVNVDDDTDDATRLVREGTFDRMVQQHDALHAVKRVGDDDG